MGRGWPHYFWTVEKVLTSLGLLWHEPRRERRWPVGAGWWGSPQLSHGTPFCTVADVVLVVGVIPPCRDGSMASCSVCSYTVRPGWYTSITAWPWWKSKIPLGLCWWGCYFLNMFCFSKHPDSWCFGRENWFFLGLCASMCPLALLVLTFLISRDSVRDTKDSVRLKENPRGHSSWYEEYLDWPVYLSSSFKVTFCLKSEVCQLNFL